jgi:toxin FitB
VFLLDTNVLSELRRKQADGNVVAWMRAVPIINQFMSVVIVQELEIGVLRAERRDPAQGMALRAWLEGQVLPNFAGRILPVDLPVARRAAALHMPNPRPFQDALIAATALVHGLTVVTRNVADFRTTGVPLLDPWQPVPLR